MELKEFIKTALSDITNAVSELQAELKNGAIINPTISIDQTITQDAKNYVLVKDDTINKIQEVSFDIAVSVADKTKKGGDSKLAISVLSLKGGLLKSNHNEKVSRISFSIPIILPYDAT